MERLDIYLMAFVYLQSYLISFWNRSWVGQGGENILDVLPSTVNEQCYPLRILCNAFKKELEGMFPGSPFTCRTNPTCSWVAFEVKQAYVSKFDVYWHFPVFMCSRNLLTIDFILVTSCNTLSFTFKHYSNDINPNFLSLCHSAIFEKYVLQAATGSTHERVPCKNCHSKGCTPLQRNLHIVP